MSSSFNSTFLSILYTTLLVLSAISIGAVGYPTHYWTNAGRYVHEFYGKTHVYPVYCCAAAVSLLSAICLKFTHLRGPRTSLAISGISAVLTLTSFAYLLSFIRAALLVFRLYYRGFPGLWWIVSVAAIAVMGIVALLWVVVVVWGVKRVIQGGGRGEMKADGVDLEMNEREGEREDQLGRQDVKKAPTLGAVEVHRQAPTRQEKPDDISSNTDKQAQETHQKK